MFNSFNEMMEEIFKKDKKIADLEAKLAERTEQLKIALKDFNDIQQENDKLAQQLAEKEKYIEEQEFAEYKEMFYATQELKEDCELKILEIEKQCAKFKQSQNQTVVTELEKVKKLLVEKMKLASDKLDCAYYINQQINELKGE